MGGFPDLDLSGPMCPSLFLLGAVPIFSGEFPDLSFSSLLAFESNCKEHVPKGPTTQPALFPKKCEPPPGLDNPQVWTTTSLPSPKTVDPHTLAKIADAHDGRRTKQAKANLDPRVGSRVAPRVGPRVEPRVSPRDRHESAHDGTHEG